MTQLTDSRYMARQYGTTANLDARIQLHARFSLNPRPWMRWVFDHLDIATEASILETGCGTGALWAENAARVPPGWRLTLTDISTGMALQARGAASTLANAVNVATADAGALPFAGASFDAVIANHMLYHVPDRPRALSELRRVLRPGGRLYASTNGAGHLIQVGELLRAVIGHQYASPTTPPSADGQMPFNLDHGGEELRRHFRDVELRRYEDALAVTDAEALLAYVRSMNVAELEGKPERWPELRRLIDEEMSRSGGVFRIEKETGLFIATA